MYMILFDNNDSVCMHHILNERGRLEAFVKQDVIVFDVCLNVNERASSAWGAARFQCVSCENDCLRPACYLLLYSVKLSHRRAAWLSPILFETSISIIRSHFTDMQNSVCEKGDRR